MTAKWRLWRTAAACCLMAAMATGCWDSKDVDNRLLVGAIGLERTAPSGLRVWFRFPLPKSTQEPSSSDFFTISQDGRTVPDALNRVKYKLPKSLDATSTRAILLSESLASSNLDPYLEFAIRERSVPLDALVAIVRGDMERIFRGRNPTGELSGIYTKLFFEPYAGGIPRKNVTRLWEVYAKVTNPYQSNLIPILTESAQNSFEFTGNAIFAGGKMVGELDKDESLLYEMFTRRFHDSEVELMNRSDVRIVHNRTRVSTAWKDGAPIIGLDCSLVATLIDSSRSQRQTAADITAELDARLSALADSMFRKTRQAEADIFGFGNRFRSRLGPEQADRWPVLFKSARISYRFHIDLRNTGLEFLD
ncbi:Ger(x)C family spore germination protein [Paenibacillus cymbidii]|uniref:Ger(x)C family spore germination protein n=1 Tax=Paenibacillus cymbidii TaxID=1639034 RepID=UPI0010800829|nr:Ger(x)C family spore germination protein [Paenibacillus cymbidii]